jgi:hypothetical protein
MAGGASLEQFRDALLNAVARRNLGFETMTDAEAAWITADSTLLKAYYDRWRTHGAPRPATGGSRVHAEESAEEADLEDPALPAVDQPRTFTATTVLMITSVLCAFALSVLTSLLFLNLIVSDLEFRPSENLPVFVFTLGGYLGITAVALVAVNTLAGNRRSLRLFLVLTTLSLAPIGLVIVSTAYAAHDSYSASGPDWVDVMGASTIILFVQVFLVLFGMVVETRRPLEKRPILWPLRVAALLSLLVFANQPGITPNLALFSGLLIAAIYEASARHSNH